jgi:hypothetical protein
MTRRLAVADRAIQRPASATDLDNVIVMMTDGENTQYRWTSTASSAAQGPRHQACDV